jgi:hypothetical protein
MLDTIAGCPSCGRENAKEIPNGATTNLVCSSCSNGLEQYSIATDHTVSRNGRLFCANIFNPQWVPHVEGLIFQKQNGSWFLLDLYTVGMQHHGIVIKAEFKDMKTGRIWPASDIYRNNDKDRSQFLRHGWWFPSNAFPAYSAIVANVRVQTTDGDTLHSVAPLANFEPIR